MAEPRYAWLIRRQQYNERRVCIHGGQKK